MAGAEALRRGFGHRLVRRRAVRGRWGGSLRCRLFARTSRRDRRRGRRIYRALHAFAEHRDADHPHIVRAPGARGITVRQVREHELGDVVVRLAPAGDLRGFPRLQHVAGLRGRGGLAGDRVHAIDREHHQYALAGGIGQAHRVAMAGHPGDPVLAAMTVLRQPLAAVAVDHIHLDEIARRQRHRAGDGGGEGEAEQQAAEHGRSPVGARDARVSKLRTRGLAQRGWRAAR